MADETHQTDNSTEPNAAEGSETVKKKVTQKKTTSKKATKKKVAKKKVATKKTASVKKAAPKKAVKPATPAPETPQPVTQTEQTSEKAAAESKTESVSETPKAATPTTVAVAASKTPAAESKVVSLGSKATSTTVVVQAKIEDQSKTPEESPMSTDTKSSSGFWIKVIFWLIIIVLGFLYIRSLAKTDATEPVTATSEAPVETITITEIVETEVTPSSSESGHTDEAMASTAGSESFQTPPPERQPTSGFSVMESTPVTIPALAAPASQAATEVSASPTSPESAAAAEPAQAPVESASPAEIATAQHQAAREAHDESVTKILKEFDDLREAAQVEMEATKNRVQAERDLQDAMAPPPPPVWYGRPGPGYAPYAPPAYQQGYPGGYYR